MVTMLSAVGVNAAQRLTAADAARSSTRRRVTPSDRTSASCCGVAKVEGIERRTGHGSSELFGVADVTSHNLGAGCGGLLTVHEQAVPGTRAGTARQDATPAESRFQPVRHARSSVCSSVCSGGIAALICIDKPPASCGRQAFGIQCTRLGRSASLGHTPGCASSAGFFGSLLTELAVCATLLGAGGCQRCSRILRPHWRWGHSLVQGPS
jgi:hypothetical protein